MGTLQRTIRKVENKVKNEITPAYLHITPAGHLVEIPYMYDAIQTVSDMRKIYTMHKNENYEGIINFFCEKLPALDDLSTIYGGDDFMLVLEAWMKESYEHHMEQEKKKAKKQAKKLKKIAKKQIKKAEKELKKEEDNNE